MAAAPLPTVRILERMVAIKAHIDKYRSTDNFEDEVKSQCDALVQLMKDAIFTGAESQELIAKLAELGLPPQYEIDVTRKINSRIGEVIRIDSRVKLQNFEALGVYFTVKEWTDTLLAKDVPGSDKLDLVLVRALGLDCKNPSEPSFQAWTTIYLCCVHGLEQVASMAAAAKHSSLTFVKQVFRKKLSETLATKPRVTKVPEVTFDEFRQLKVLNLDGFGGLVALPLTLGGLVDLHTLHLRECEALETLPASIRKLRKLSTLNLTSCKELQELQRQQEKEQARRKKQKEKVAQSCPQQIMALV